MSDIKFPTIEDTTRIYLELARALIPGIDTTPDGIAYREARVNAGATGSVHEHVEAVARDSTPVTAEGDALEQWAELRGVIPKGATTSVGVDALRVSGTAAASVGSGLTLIDRATLVEVVTTSAGVLDADGYATVSVESVTKGARANLPSGSVLQFAEPPAGVDDNATLVLSMGGAVDEELDGLLRERAVNRFQEPPQGGNNNDFAQWVLLTDGIDEGFALGKRNGVGTTDLVGLRSGEGTARFPSLSLRNAILDTVAALDHMTSQVRVLDPVANVVDIDVQVTPTSSSIFDWDDATPLEVASWDSGTSTVTTTEDLPEDLGVGDRIVFSDDGRVFLVGAISGVDSFVLASDSAEDLASYEPSATVLIYAGGPITTPVRDALLNGYPAADGSRVPGINNLGPANEEAQYGDWVDTVEVGRAVAAALSVPGVYRASVASLEVDGVDVGDVARPSDPADDPLALSSETAVIGVLIPGVVLVRSA